jgi:hypothetical protein
MADFEECGMSVFGYGLNEKATKGAVEKLRRIVADAEKDFALELHLAGDAVRRARERGAPGKPVVLADTQDNPGAGGNGDTTGVLRTLIEQKAQDAVLGLLIDAPSAQRAHEAGQGASVVFNLGGISKIPGDAPLSGEFTVERLADGRFTCTGPMFKGFRMTLGNMALLRSRAAPGCARGAGLAQGAGRRPGNVPPCRHRAAVPAHHGAQELGAFSRRFRAHRQGGPRGQIARPGARRSREFKWTKLRKGVRLRPLGPVHA